VVGTVKARRLSTGSTAGPVRLPTPRIGTPGVLVDHPGLVAEFLNELDLFDVIVELVQNELDAGSRRTEIEIGDDALICSGRGERMSDKGWQRLRYVLGAGSLVDAKADGIGSKNHGIRACFLLGDQITVQSDGKRIDLTVCGLPDDLDRFYPASWDPEPSPDAPRTGVRVIVPYRTRPIDLPDRNALVPKSATELDDLFVHAVHASSDRFLCASAPGKTWRYELVLRRRELVVRLTFAATAADRDGLNLRTCQLARGPRSGSITARRHCYAFPFQLAQGDTAKVPALFKVDGAVTAEISWAVDSKGRPLPSAGSYRYPIAFPIEDTTNAHGFDVSGPFVAGKARHSLGSDKRNDDLADAGLDAFVGLMRETLVPRHGPAALQLVQSTGRTNSAAVAALTGRLLADGGFPLYQPAARSRRASEFSISVPGVPLHLPIPSHRHGALDANLAALAPTSLQILYPDCPPEVILALRSLAETAKGVEIFSELEAAQSVFVDEAPLTDKKDARWLPRCLAAIRQLELARLEGTLSAANLGSLKATGRLPLDDGAAYPWRDVRRARFRSLRIPGVSPPPILQEQLKNSPILREGAASVSRFDLDTYLSELDFVEAGASARTAFFRWLRTGHADLTPKSLAKIATYPVWPDTSGACYPLVDYCYPRAAYLRDALAQVLPMPATSVVRFPGLRRSSIGALRLRSTPELHELRRWHTATTSRISELATHNDLGPAIAEIATLEHTLDQMRADNLSPRQFAEGHVSVSKAQAIRPIADLHVETAAVATCGLLEEDLLPNQRKALYLALGAKSFARPEALLRALRLDPRRERLAARLSAWRASGRPMLELAREEIVEEDGVVLQPCHLALALPTDYWGDWKRRIRLQGPSAEEIRLLEDAGVVRLIKEDSSLGFFAWLAKQPATVMAKHRPQVVRHWLDHRAGPSRWAAVAALSPCILLRDGAGTVSLASHRAATMRSAAIFLPDLPSIEKDLLADHRSVRVAIISSPGVDGSALHELHAIGIKSLAAQVGSPKELLLVGDSQRDAGLDLELTKIRSSRVRNHLKAALPRHGVPGEALDRSWRSNLKEIRDALVAPGVEAVYVFKGKRYPASVESGYDRAEHLICISQTASPVIAFYDALASRLFTQGSPPSYAHGLHRAVHELASLAKARTIYGEELDLGLDDADAADGSDDDDDDGPTKGGENRKAHGSPSDLDPFLPKPGKLGKLDKLTFTKTARKPRASRKPSATDDRRHSLEEDAQINSLKNDHYAVHCQACIGAMEVLEAAPQGSYVYSPHYRRSLIEAHHVRHLANHAKSAPREALAGQGAANVLILCRFHHGILGDQLSRQMVINALGKAQPGVRHFPDKVGALVARPGVLASSALPAEPFAITLFFTGEHRSAWLA
jgi:hypothetical protein